MTRQFFPPSQSPLSPEQIAYARTTNMALQSRLKLVEWENLITHITARIKGEFNQDIVTRCPNKIANLDCVPKDSASVGAFTGTAAQAINAGVNHPAVNGEA